MELIVLGHIIGDFYLQTKFIAEKKKEHLGFLILHSFLYCIQVIMAVVVIGNNKIESYLVFSILLFLTHLAVDKIKSMLDKRGRYAGIIFLGDQVIHLLLLVILLRILGINIQDTSWVYKYLEKIEIVAITAILVCWKPAAIFVSIIFESIFLSKTNWKESSKKEDKNKVQKNKNNEPKENIRVGYWIGVLEREIILVLGLLGQYGAIGFVLTAKSLARFKQLEEQEFAEKYLIGTLLSAFIAFCCLYLCSRYK